MSTIKDCFGVEARVGDAIFFSRGNAGAQPWERSVITKITAKTITFDGKTGGEWRTASEQLRRGNGCFVIDLEARNG